MVLNGSRIIVHTTAMHNPRTASTSNIDILRVVLIYGIFAGLWILVSDQLTEWMFGDSAMFVIASLIKGWLFVAITCLLLYLLLKRSKYREQGKVAPKRIVGIVDWKLWQLYLFAATATLLTVLILTKITVSMGERPMLILLMLPIILSAALGGIGPGLFATVIAALFAVYYSVPSGSFNIAQPHDLLQLGFLLANGLIVSFLSMMLHQARHRSERERQKAETSLADKTRSIQLLDAIAQGSTDAVFAMDVQGRYLLVSGATARFLGTTVEDMLGKNNNALFPPAQAEAIDAANRRVMSEGQTITLEETLATVDGPKAFLTTKGPMLDAEGKTIGIFGIARDISGLKEIESALRRERDRNQRYLDTVQNIMVALDNDGRIVMINRYGCSLLGYAESELLGKNWFECCLPQPEGMERVYLVFRRSMATDWKEAEYYENLVLCRDGSRCLVLWHNTFITNEVGNIVGLLSSGEDVTERRKAEDSLRESETTYRSLFEHMLNGFAYCRMLYADGRPDDFVYLGVNAAFETHTGLKDVAGRKVSEVIPGIREADPELFEIYGRVASGGKPERFETFVKALDMWFEIAVYSPKPEHFVAVFDVVTERKKAEYALRKSSALLQSVVESVPARVFWKDRDSRYLGCNSHFARDAGYSVATDLVGKTDFEMGWKAQAELYRTDDNAVMESGVPKLDFEEPSTTPDGTTIWLRTSKVPLRDETDQTIGILGVYEDITARKQAEKQLRELSLAVEQSPESIVITDLDGNIEYANEITAKNTGYPRDELIGKNPRVLQSGKTPKSVYADLWQHLAGGEIWEGEFHNKRKDGSEYIEHAIISPIRQPDGRITHFLAVKEDITEKKRAKADIHRLAFYDTLTGLPNRALLLERTTQALATISRIGEYTALISFNVDRFKTLNDAGGQALGDALLKAVGERLSGIMHEGDVVARIAGDEFAILLSDLAPEQQAAAHLALRVSDKIHTNLLVPFRIGDEFITITACLGIALFPGNAEDTPLDILRRANTALHHAKSRGGEQTAFFEGALDDIARQRFNIERELRQAIDNGELRVFLQPQVEASGKIVGAKALVRWQHPQNGLIAPGLFIPIAEESNLIVEIGEWVFTEVCTLLAREDMSNLPIRIAVNISPRHFRQADFVEQIHSGIVGTGADPTHLTLEVTEGMLIDNIDDVIAKMSELIAMGIHFSMDDFGTGYSSLSYLKRLPIHELKIDKSFIQDLTINPEDDALVETILAVAKLMHVNVVAEGVETKEQAAFLNDRGSVIHQGYLYGRPEPAAKFIANLIKNMN